ncbi:MAG: radical SAM family RiPP maturation amino acid epimerase [Planctomycetota bacterium]
MMSNAVLKTTSACAIKRCIEILRGDGDVRARCEASPQALEELMRDHGVAIDPSLLAGLWKLQPTEEEKERSRHAPELAEWWALANRRNDYVKKLRDLPDRDDTPFRSWRRRQIARCEIELHDALNKGLPHVAVAIELSSGCSVGCWFCGISADKFQGSLAFDEAGRTLWRGVLDALQDQLGDGLGSAALYWATDPTDNEDYLKFSEDFYQVTGHLPQATTARPLKNIAWTRDMIRLRQDLGIGGVDRFSLLSTKELRGVHEEFSPEDLQNVEFVYHNKGALGDDQMKTKAGRARVRAENSSRPLTFNESQDTIACVTGFLVNLVEKRIRLISPCAVSEQWPDGFRVYADAQFESPEHLRRILAEWNEKVFTHDALDRPVLGFHRAASYEPTDTGFTLSTRYKTRRIEGAPEIRFLGDRLSERRWTRQEILDQGTRAGFALLSLVSVLGQLCQHGLLDDDPSRAEPEQPER